ncbi:MAG TPA: DUF1015 domain-containing protein [Gaiellaceae bacterium]|nr:DUF1015 domain-containing protein [Gaiellaceae bacterium]
MPALSPFRALRYDESAGALADLVAPPYDVVGPEQRERLAARSPYNVVHLTLPSSPEEAARALADWRGRGVLREEAPALWWLEQTYTGPDGVERTREGIAGALEATPYAAGEVLPHERTHEEPKAGRLALLRATRTQLEPIFLLYDGDPPASRPGGEPVLEVDEGGVRTRLWRLPAEALEFPAPLLVADGHHRYETAVAYREEQPEAERTFAVLVSSRSPGLEVFPTHRIVPDLEREPDAIMTSTWDQGSLTLYRQGNFFRIDSSDELDAREVDRYGSGFEYTPNAQEAIEAVDSGLYEAAFLVRAPTVAQVAEFARRGETMPQKSTFFYPKLTSGLLLFPL